MVKSDIGADADVFAVVVCSGAGGFWGWLSLLLLLLGGRTCDTVVRRMGCGPFCSVLCCSVLFCAVLFCAVLCNGRLVSTVQQQYKNP